MKAKYTEYQRFITTSYILLIMVVMPLYMKDGMNMIGDGKYLFYRNISVLFMLLWLAGELFYLIYNLCMRSKHKASEYKFPLCPTEKNTAADIVCILFLTETVLSFLFSSFKDTAWSGYSGWYMGLLTWLLIIGGYFCVLRWNDGSKAVWCCIFLSVTAVSAIGLLNRFEYDPLNVYKYMERWDWDRRNLISTIGNINWYCSYLAAMLPVIIWFFWAGKGYKRIFTGAAAFIGFGSMLLQGSDSGYIALFVMLTVLLFASLRDAERLLRFIEVIFLIPLFWLFISVVNVHLFIPDDMPMPLWGHVTELICILIILAAIYAVIVIYGRRVENNIINSGLVFKIVSVLFIVLLFASVTVFVLCQISDGFWQAVGGYGVLKFDDEWGNLRGALWKESLKGFMNGSFVEKLYGAGPDCFARFFYEKYSINAAAVGKWDDSIYANAHNEWLTMLINQGILGLILYVGIFVSAFLELKKNISKNKIAVLGIMSLAAYAVNNFFSFSQVVSTPLVFLIMALCLNECRHNN